MSSQRGNVKKQGPKYQNSFAFKHNPKSKKTKLILEKPIEGLCFHCHEQIIWRKKFRKYKPLTQPGNCNYCHQKTVLAAYHVICQPCAKYKNCCAKCLHKKEIVLSEREEKEIEILKQKEQNEILQSMSERERRSYMRQLNESIQDTNTTPYDIDSLAE